VLIIVGRGWPVQTRTANAGRSRFYAGQRLEQITGASRRMAEHSMIPIHCARWMACLFPCRPDISCCYAVRWLNPHVILDQPKATTMPLRHDQRRPVPEWLTRLNPKELGATAFPLDEALQHSLYYPAAGFDGRPVQFLGGFIHSFIYVDYGMEEQAVDAQAEAAGFLGYQLAGSKHLTERELTPNGWRAQVPPQFRDQIHRFEERRAGGFVESPFATWYIFDRDDDRDEGHGPQRFSLVYICADGVATYQALYWQNQTAPEVIAIIQPDTGFGGNYTDFRDPGGFFAWTVLQGNCHYFPEYLVCGEIGPLGRTRAFWPEAYPDHVEWFQHENGNGVWRRYRNADERGNSAS
jgi:hypothetical protein